MRRRHGSAKKPPTITDVARAAKVSTVSVSRVLNNYPNLRERTRTAVRRAVQELGYVPNAAAQMLKTNRSHMIGCVVNDIANSANALTVRAAERVLNASGNLLVTASNDMDERREVELIELLTRRGVDGLIVQPTNEDSVITQDAIAKCGVPVVVIDRDIPIATDRVLINYYDAMREVTRYLLDLGHRDIALIVTEEGTRTSRERVRAFKDEMASQRAEIRAGRISAGSHVSQRGFNVTMTLMSADPRPTALIAAGNQLMQGAIQALKALKVSIPKQLSFVGAEEADISSLLDPPITIIERDMSALGRHAAELLLRRLASGTASVFETTTLPSRVILRRSCIPIGT